MITRRHLLQGTAALPLFALSFPARGNESIELLKSSRLIYLSPLKSDGSESTCKGEVWFVFDADTQAIYVNTQYEAWRANAIRKGLDQARIWIGEYGNWRTGGGSFKAAPQLQLTGEVSTVASDHERALRLFGAKYVDEWSTWGPRFRDGLTNASRAMLKYRINS